MPTGAFKLEDVPPRTMLEMMVQDMYRARKEGRRQEFVEQRMKKIPRNYTEDHFVRDLTFLALLTYTGVRISEIVGRNVRDMKNKYNQLAYDPAEDCIRVQDLDTLNRRLRIPQRKKRLKEGKALWRIIIVLPPLRPILVDRIGYRRLLPYQPLMASITDPNRPVNLRTARNIVYRRTKVYFGKPIRPHAFRHAFATELIRRGINVEAIRRILGHSSLNVTQIYLDLTLEDLRGIMESAFGTPMYAQPQPMMPYYPQQPPMMYPYAYPPQQSFPAAQQPYAYPQQSQTQNQPVVQQPYNYPQQPPQPIVQQPYAYPPQPFYPQQPYAYQQQNAQPIYPPQQPPAYQQPQQQKKQEEKRSHSSFSSSSSSVM